MKFTVSWLRDHLDTDADLARIRDTLDRIGLEVESIENRGATLAPFRIARVVEAAQHPNADRLRVCQVDTGDNIVSVVCGAPNARTGMTAVFAPPGSFIPGTGVTLKVGEIRGVKSAGMLLSAREMGLGDDHSGILDLPDDAPVGRGYADWAGLDDPVIEIAVTPNRGDALGVRGIARDLAAAGVGRLKPWDAPAIPANLESPIRWAIAMPAFCPWVLGRTIRNLKNSPSPKWLAERLTAIGLRPINTVVDITNLFTIDLARPLHVFDVGKIAGDTLTMRAGCGETFRALNGKDYTLTGQDCAIADARGAQSMAGVMGGEATGCDEFTTSVFIECALFDPVRVALTGRRHQVASDARHRFERGIDPALMPAALEAATRMVLDLCGGEPSEVVEAGSPPRWQRYATLRFRRLAEFGGVAIPPDEAAAALERLGFGVEQRDGDKITVAVPPWRNDIAAIVPIGAPEVGISPSLDPGRAESAAEGATEVEPECDLIEEVLRLHGLDAIPPVSLPRAAPVPGHPAKSDDFAGTPVPLATLTPRQSRAELARRVLAAQGLAECVTFSFTARRDAELFGDAAESLHLLNPIAADLDQLRPSPLATLARAAQHNAARGFPDCALFEIGPAFADAAEQGQRPGSSPGQALVAAGVRTGATPRNWAALARKLDAFDAKGDVLAVLAALGVGAESFAVTADAPGFYHPGRSGVVRQGPKTVLATFGELHPRVLTALDLDAAAVAFEVFLDAIPEPKRRRKSAPDLPPLQPVRRDFAFLLDAAIPADAVLRAARGAERHLIAGVALFDRYEGEKLPAGKKSLAIEVVFQPRERTLTEAEIEAAAAKLVAAVAKATGGALR